ncbi:sensor histidine kinase [Occallatibacter riparius]|uniref:Histidine kinase n=1 Tax=Occallatibacter riparius TaxID=1002689 RepID=A0A9J7BTU8_9BACT|nr:sensor histidine kinase [Occallatibacter riparius]UWZ85170.1 histidine kinase [Occallatibacter riparius]
MTRTLLFLPRRLFRLERFALFLNIFFLCCANLSAIDPHQPITQMHHTAWGAKEGVIGEVLAIAQTSDGFIWVGTTNGLLRFDGSVLERYQPDLGAFPEPRWICSLLAMPNGGLWIGYLNGGASLLERGRLKNYSLADGMPAGRVRSLARDVDGTIWAATPAGVGYFDGSHWWHVGETGNVSGLKSISPASLAVDNQGVWVTDATKGVFFLPKGAREFHQEDSREVPGYLPSFTQAGESATWLWVPEALTLLKLAARGAAQSGSSRQFANSSGMFLIDRDGTGWMMTRHDGVLRIPSADHLQEHVSLDDPTIEKFSETEGLTNATVYCSMEDREGDIWVGTLGGLDRFRPRNAEWFQLQSVPTRRMQLVAGDRGDVWASSPQGLWNARSGKLVPGSPPDIQFSFRDPEGSIWVWSRRGDLGDLWRWQDGHFLKSLSPDLNRDKVLPTSIADKWVPIHGPVRALTRDSSGDLWVSVRGRGVFRLHNQVWDQARIMPDYPYMTAYGAVSDGQGRVWLAYPELREIALWDHGSVQIFSAKTGLDIGAVTQLAYSGEQVWAGGEFGLAIYSKGRFHTVVPASEAKFGLVAGIAGTPESGLWLSTDTEIVHIPQSEVSLIIRDPSHRVQFETFDPITDLAERPSDTSDTPAVMGSDGILWVATSRGVIRLDPAHLHRNLTPPLVAIRSMSANGRSYSLYAPITLPPNTTKLDIGFSVLSLPIPERARSRYRLLGSDSEWQDGGSRVQASYTRLGPGKYTFQVVARNNDGVWNEAGTSLEFIIQPAFYQTTWFQLLYVLAGAVLVWLLYRLRLRRVAGVIRERAEARADERVRIARDLHDTLLQGVQGLMLHFHVAAQELPEGSRTRAAMERALATADRIVVEGRDRVSRLRSAQFTAKNLTDAFEAIADDLGSDQRVRFTLKIEGRGGDVVSSVLSELHDIGREAITNAFRHSSASEITVSLLCERKSVVLTVADNGHGFDAAAQEISPRAGHWGFRGMKERAEIMGARFACHSTSKGSQIIVTVPAHRAYRESSLREVDPANAHSRK